MTAHLRYKSIWEIEVKTPGKNIRLAVPNFNWKYLPHATAKGGTDHILIRLRAADHPKENEIVAVKKNGGTVGFVIPGAALNSISHSFAKDPMFGPYALIAINKIIKELEQEKSKVLSDDVTSLDQIIDNRFFYCIVDAIKCEVQTSDEFLDLYFPQLMNRGFVDGLQFGAEKIGIISTKLGDGDIHLYKTLELSPFVRNALFGMIPFESNPFFSFFYAWQVVEYFMQREFDKKLLSFVEAHNKSVNIVDARRSLDKLNEIAKEKNRVKAVFHLSDPILTASIENVYKKIYPNEVIVQGELTATIAEDENDKLENSTESGDSEKNSEHLPAMQLYQIRNIVFHSFSQIQLYQDSMRELIINLLAYLVNKCGAKP